MSAGSKLTRKQEAAIAALLSERTHADAAAKAGIGPATLQRWLDLPEFQAAYRAARQSVLERVVARLLNSCGKALDTLDRNMSCGSPGAENKAAELVLTQALKGLEVLDHAERLAEVEKRVGVTGGTP